VDEEQLSTLRLKLLPAAVSSGACGRESIRGTKASERFTRTIVPIEMHNIIFPIGLWNSRITIHGTPVMMALFDSAVHT